MLWWQSYDLQELCLGMEVLMDALFLTLLPSQFRADKCHFWHSPVGILQLLCPTLAFSWGPPFSNYWSQQGCSPHNQASFALPQAILAWISALQSGSCPENAWPFPQHTSSNHSPATRRGSIHLTEEAILQRGIPLLGPLGHFLHKQTPSRLDDEADLFNSYKHQRKIKTSEEELKKTKISNLPDTEFKVIFI